MMMKLSFFVIAFVGLVQALHPTDDIYFHTKAALGPSMWHFSSQGLKVFHPSSGNVLKHTPQNEFCEPYESFDQSTNETFIVDTCRFFSFANDGHRFVWAGGRAESDRVEAFDIDTGTRVGFTSTCRVPMDMGYHVGRRELFVHCHTAEIDVFSVHALGIDHEKIDLEVGGFPSARLMVHSALGAYGYSANSRYQGLIEVDLASRKVKNFHPMPDVDSVRDMAFSAVNRHIYARTRVCCTCGFEGADADSCGRRSSSTRPVNITTGPSVGINVNGTCGSACAGSKADTIGVYEFDTVSRQVVGSHNIDPVNGHGAVPVTTPNGQYAFLFGADGGNAVVVLKPGENGKPSTKLGEITVNFKGLPGNVVIDDFAHVMDESRNIVVFGANSDNDIVLVDMSSDSSAMRMRKLSLTSAAESTAEGSERQVEWAVGTNYVWVTGSEASEVYVVEVPTSDINDAKLVQTIGGVPAGDLFFVDNYERKAMQAMISELGSVMASDNPEANNAEFLQDNSDDNDDDTSPLAIAALTVGCVALLVSTMAIVKAFSSSMPAAPTASSAGPSNNKDETSGDEAEVDVDHHMETKTLGSKMVA